MLNIPNNLPDKAGIFAFVCKNTGQALIAFSSISMKDSASYQLSILRGDRHYNRFLQEDFNQYGEESILIILLEETIARIGEKKLEWMAKWRNNYNILNSEKTNKRSEQWVDKMRKINLGRKQNLSEAQREAYSERSRGENNARAKLNEGDVYVIRRLLDEGMTCRAVAKMYDVNHTSIYNVGARKTWAHLQ